MHNRNGKVSYGLGLLWGAIGGVVGAYFSSPFYLVRQLCECCRGGYINKLLI